MLNGGWEYDHGYFDYKIDDRDGYLFLRVPVNAVQGSLDERGAAVRIGTPFMLRQVLQTDVDDQAEGGPFQSLFNQFSERERRDAEIDPAFLDRRLSRERIGGCSVTLDGKELVCFEHLVCKRRGNHRPLLFLYAYNCCVVIKEIENTGFVSRSL